MRLECVPELFDDRFEVEQPLVLVAVYPRDLGGEAAHEGQRLAKISVMPFDDELDQVRRGERSQIDFGTIT